VSGEGPSRVAHLDESGLLARPEVVADLVAIAERRGAAYEDVEREAATCLEELAVRPRARWLDGSARLARFMITRAYEVDLDVNTDRLEALKALAGRQPLVFLWSHKSHLDSFVFLRVMYDAGFRPQPLSFAGINMAFAGFGTLAKRSGAIFLRRSFADDAVYKAVFRHYIDYLARERVPLSWAIEGTRSRTGKLMPPKLGLIQWVTDAYARHACDDALLVPVSISFDQIAEMDDYVAMQRGLPKRRESLGWFLGYIRGMKTPFGRIYVRFAEPVSLAEALPGRAGPADAGGSPGRVRVQKLAFEVMSRIEHATPITGTDLATLVLLGANDRALGRGEIDARAAEILRLVRERGLPTAGSLAAGTDPAEAMDRALAELTRTGVLQRHDGPDGPLHRIAPGKHLAAAYYRNTIVHYFLNAAIAELALAMADEATGPGAEETALALRDLLKFEFFFKAREAFLDDVRAHLDARFPGWREADGAAGGRPPPLFAPGILGSFVEVYRILAEWLERAPPNDPGDDPHRMAADCLALGEDMLLRRHIDSEAALSQPLLENALALARHRGLLAPDAGEARAAFGEALRGAHAAIRRLRAAAEAAQAAA